MPKYRQRGCFQDFVGLLPILKKIGEPIFRRSDFSVSESIFNRLSVLIRVERLQVPMLSGSDSLTALSGQYRTFLCEPHSIFLSSFPSSLKTAFPTI